MTENDVKADVKKYLDNNGWMHFPNVQNFRGHCVGRKGVSDRTAMKNGIVIYIEIKKPGGKQNKNQILFESDVLDAKCNYVCVDSVEKLHNYIMSIRNSK